MSGKKKFSIEQISFLAALCMFLSAIEYAIPKPLPFLRLGLANLPILVSLKKLSIKEILVLIFFKILVQSLISGTIFSYVFLLSFSGSSASGVIMLLGYFVFFKTGFVSNIGLSLFGAFANCFAQLVCSKFIMFGENTKYVAPVLLISSFVSGFALGLFANVFENKSRWYKEFCGKTEFYKFSWLSNSDNVHRISTEKNVEMTFVEKLWKNSVFRFVISLFSMVTLLLVKSVWVQFFIFALFFLLATIKRHGKVNWISSVLVLIFITLFSLINPFGKVLFAIGKWKICLGSLLSGLQRSFVLLGMVYISQFAVDKNIKLPGKIGFIISYIFLTFDKLISEKIFFKPKKIIENIDNKLIQILENK